jgi:hypothetical protein
MLWRQGDVLIQTVDAIPPGYRPLKRPVLASSDSTGHRHQIRDRQTARLYSAPDQFNSDMYLDVTADEAQLVHPEHDTIVLQRGQYRVWRQREYTVFGGYRTVID